MKDLIYIVCLWCISNACAQEATIPETALLPVAQDVYRWISIDSLSLSISWTNKFAISINKAVTGYSLTLKDSTTNDLVHETTIHNVDSLSHSVPGVRPASSLQGSLNALVGHHKWAYQLLNFSIQSPRLLDGFDASKYPNTNGRSYISDLNDVKFDIRLKWNEKPFIISGAHPKVYIIKLWKKAEIILEETAYLQNRMPPNDKEMYFDLRKLPLDQLFKVTLEGRSDAEAPGMTLSYSLDTGSLVAGKGMKTTGGVEGCFSALQVRCPKSDRCVSPYWICDGSKDCPDGSDEDGCKQNKCENGFSCWGSTNCLPSSWRCDGYEDCSDGEDELGCGNCHGNYLLRCGTGNDCVSTGYACDGQQQCPDGWDESEAVCNETSSMKSDFTVETCLDGTISCGANGGCITSDLTCNGIAECPNGEDESTLLCTLLDTSYTKEEPITSTTKPVISPQAYHSLTSSIPPPTITDSPLSTMASSLILEDHLMNNFHSSSCRGDEFDCGDGWCVPLFWLCDGRLDCLNGEDEEPGICSPVLKQIDGETTDQLIPEINFCFIGQFKCKSGLCIAQSSVCDQAIDCPGGDDEVDCSETNLKTYNDHKMTNVEANAEYSTNSPIVSPISILDDTFIEPVSNHINKELHSHQNTIYITSTRKPVITTSFSSTNGDSYDTKPQTPTTEEPSVTTGNIHIHTSMTPDEDITRTTTSYVYGGNVGFSDSDNPQLSSSPEIDINSQLLPNPTSEKTTNLTPEVNTPKVPIMTTGTSTSSQVQANFTTKSPTHPPSKSNPTIEWSIGTPLASDTNLENPTSPQFESNTTLQEDMDTLIVLNTTTDTVISPQSVLNSLPDIPIISLNETTNITNLIMTNNTEADLGNSSEVESSGYIFNPVDDLITKYLSFNITDNAKSSSSIEMFNWNSVMGILDIFRDPNPDIDINSTSSSSNSLQNYTDILPINSTDSQNSTSQQFQNLSEFSDPYSFNFSNQLFLSDEASKPVHLNTPSIDFSSLDYETLLEMQTEIERQVAQFEATLNVTVPGNDSLIYVDYEEENGTLMADEVTKQNHYNHTANITHDNVSFTVDASTNKEGYLILPTTSPQVHIPGNTTVLVAIHGAPFKGARDYVVHDTDGNRYQYQVIKTIDKPLLERNDAQNKESPYLLEKIITFRLEANGKLLVEPTRSDTSLKESEIIRLFTHPEKHKNCSIFGNDSISTFPEKNSKNKPDFGINKQLSKPSKKVTKELHRTPSIQLKNETDMKTLNEKVHLIRMKEKRTNGQRKSLKRKNNRRNRKRKKKRTNNTRRKNGKKQRKKKPSTTIVPEVSTPTELATMDNTLTNELKTFHTFKETNLIEPIASESIDRRRLTSLRMTSASFCLKSSFTAIIFSAFSINILHWI